MQKCLHPILSLVVVLASCFADKIEVIEETGCADSEFRLTCARLTSLIAILEAGLYTPDSQVYENGNRNQTRNRTTQFGSTNCRRMYKAHLQRDLFEWIHVNNNKVPVKGVQNLRGPLNNRCSGKNHCSFKLHEDHRNSEQWGPGLVRITYACMAESSISRLCGASLTRSTGFIMSPGYPGYYVGGLSCFWTITPPPGLQVEFLLLDVSLRDIVDNESFCVDSLTITDHTIGRHLIRTCGESQKITSISSQGDQKLTVTFTTRSKNIYPKRGFLLYYKVTGCKLPQLPKGVKIIQLSSARRGASSKAKDIVVPYLSQHVVYKYFLRVPYSHTRRKTTYDLAPRGKHRRDNRPEETNTNHSSEHSAESDAKSAAANGRNSLPVRARYSCAVEGYVFPDTLSEERILVCVDGRTWNNTLPSCIDIKENKIDTTPLINEAKAVMANEQGDMFFDIIVPSLLIGGLLFGNAIILFIIYRYRRRHPPTSSPEINDVPSSSVAP